MRLLFEIFAQTLRTLWAHKLRSFLTMFGIAWGIGSLLLLVGLGEGFRTGQRKEFNELGENVMFIWGGRAPAVNGSFTSMRQYYLTYKDYQDIAAECFDVNIAVPVIQRQDIDAMVGRTAVACRIKIPHPRLWWPNGMGEQPHSYVSIIRARKF